MRGKAFVDMEVGLDPPGVTLNPPVFSTYPQSSHSGSLIFPSWL